MATQRTSSEKEEGCSSLQEGHQPLLDAEEAASSFKQLRGPCDIDAVDFDSASGSEKAQHDQGDTDHESDSLAETDDISELSNLSGLNDEHHEASWQPLCGPRSWIRQQIAKGVDPRNVLRAIINLEDDIPDEYDQYNLWEVILNLLIDPVPRRKLTHVNTLDDVADLLKNCQNIMVLTGAGVSVSCGIPDFRSRDGIYARLAKDYPNLPDPESMFDIQFFKSDQRPFFKFAKEIYPGQFKPSPCHKFIKLLETKGKLLRNYTQNIDTIEKVAGIEHVIECHGSFATATCMECRYKVDAEDIREDIFAQVIPQCPQCGPDKLQAVMKPDIVFFGEDLPEKFHKQMAADKDACDLLIVMGSSLKVRPVALIPNAIPHHVPQILINREPLTRQLLNFDIELLGNCDDIVSELCKMLGSGWDHLSNPGPLAKTVNYADLPEEEPAVVSPQPPLVGVKVKGEVVEHNADSGLGDLETASTSTQDEAGSRLSSGLLACSNGTHSGLRGDRLERLSSSDSGTESSVTAELQTQSLASAASEHCSGVRDLYSKSDSKNSNKKINSGCIEVSAQGEYVCGKDQADLQGCQCQTGHSSQNQEAGHHTSHLSSHLKRCRNKSESDGSSTGPHPSGDGEQTSKRRRYSEGMGDGEKFDLDLESGNDNAHCEHTDTFAEMRQKWVQRRTRSIACRLEENEIIFMPPSRYIFPGAEVYCDSSDSSDSSDDSTPPLSPRADEEKSNTSNVQTANSALPQKVSDRLEKDVTAADGEKSKRPAKKGQAKDSSSPSLSNSRQVDSGAAKCVTERSGADDQNILPQAEKVKTVNK